MPLVKFLFLRFWLSRAPGCGLYKSCQILKSISRLCDLVQANYLPRLVDRQSCLTAAAPVLRRSGRFPVAAVTLLLNIKSHSLEVGPFADKSLTTPSDALALLVCLTAPRVGPLGRENQWVFLHRV